MKRALVLSGGGARGSYQIGVWKAFRDLNINFDIVTGTSVGALNGALMVQDTFELAESYWSDVNFEKVFNDEFFKNKELIKRRTKIVGKYARAVFSKKGLDVKALEENLEENLDIETFYSSKLDYGLVIYDLNSREPVMLTKKDIPKDKLKDYIVASATVFPVFKKKQIEDRNYIDGGYYDNLPINLAVKMGATEIVAVYIGVFGLVKAVRNKDVKITYIKPKSKLGSPLYFNGKQAKRGIRLGYNDTMKVYGKFEGDIYTFEKSKLNKYYRDYRDNIKELICDIFKKQLSVRIPRSLKKWESSSCLMKELINIIEYLGTLFNIDESYIYNINEFNKFLVNHFNELDKSIKSTGFKKITTRLLNNRKYVIWNIYFNLLSIDNIHSIRELIRLSLLHPNAFMSAVYLYTLLNKKSFVGII